MAKFQVHKDTLVNQLFDATGAQTGVGGVAGLIQIPGVQINPNVYVTGGTKGASGSLVRQKGRGKFIVADSTSVYPNAMTAGNAYIITTVGNTNWAKFTNNYTSYSNYDSFTVQTASASDASTGRVNAIGVCTLANLPAANLSAGQMSLPINLNSFSANIGNLGISTATTFASVIWANANVAGVSKPTIGTTLSGVGGITGNVTITSIAAYGTNGSNANVAINSQVVANAATATVSSYVFAARLTNKFVTDFNNNKYTWGNNAPSSSLVQLPTA